MTTKVLGDDIHQQFSNSRELINRLEEVERNTTWVQRNVKQFLVNASEVLAKGTDLWKDEYLIHTHKDGTQLVLMLDGKATGIRECAKNSLFARLGIGGQIIDWLDPAGIKKICMTGTEYAPEKDIKIAITEGKVNAFLSSQYDNSISAATIFNEMEKYINSICKKEDVEFDADWSYSETVANYIIPVERTLDDKTYKVGITLATSDAGYSGANFRAFLTGNGHKEVPLMSSMSIIHRGNSGIVRLSETLAMLEKAIDGGMSKLNRLMSVTITNPKATMKRVARACKLPKKESLELIDKFECEGSCSAFRCYLCLAKVLNAPATMFVKQERTGNVAKMIAINWAGYDLAGDYAW